MVACTAADWIKDHTDRSPGNNLDEGEDYLSGPTDIWVTLPGCQTTCPKPYFDLYGDMWPRLITWLVPVLLLIGSVHLPRIGYVNRVLVILHSMGEPVNSM
ncbi:hypothetical protein N657DRAFT_636432 [Parathielavia appendiculata]|uniref:Uncharacterized protein n=1 Tax=Parathielavia appendiculata TaxID=2587402 RepID=A0AAN6TV33_9PEZI|nr:hypothetical protein N657DRAFT_636432 [Parathielavia appendiculata]